MANAMSQIATLHPIALFLTIARTLGMTAESQETDAAVIAVG
jgi:hypothetical protein